MVTEDQLYQAEKTLNDAKALHTEMVSEVNNYSKYISDMKLGLYNPNSPILENGPLTISQAAKINLQISKDYGFPLVYIRNDVKSRAMTYAPEAEKELVRIEKQLENAQKYYDELKAKFDAQNKQEVQAANEDIKEENRTLRDRLGQARRLNRGQQKMLEKAGTGLFFFLVIFLAVKLAVK